MAGEGQNLQDPLMAGDNVSEADQRGQRITAIMNSEEYAAYLKQVEQFNGGCGAIYLTGGVAAVLVGSTVVGFLTPLNLLMLMDRVFNRTSDFDALSLTQTTTFAPIVLFVFAVKGVWVNHRLIRVFGQAPKGLYTCGKHFLASMHGIFQALAPLSLVVGVTLGNILSRYPSALPWLPSAITPPRAFAAAGLLAMMGELTVPDEEPGIDHEGFWTAVKFVFSRFKELSPWEIVALFLLVADIDFSAETDNYWGHPVVAQSISLGLTPLLGIVLLVIAAKQCGTGKFSDATVGCRSRLGCDSAADAAAAATDTTAIDAAAGDDLEGGPGSAVASADGTSPARQLQTVAAGDTDDDEPDEPGASAGLAANHI